MTALMRAVRFHDHGGPEVLRLEALAVPAAGPGEVRVKVAACGLNHLDIWTRRGMERVDVPLPHVPGVDIAGHVDSVGPGVEGWAEGDAVVVYPLETCGSCPACSAGQEQRCRHGRMIGGYHRDGGYADYVTVRAATLVPWPEGLSAVEAAALPVAYTNAWHMVHDKGEATHGDDVLVTAASGGVATACVQLASAAGCRVIATVSSPDKADPVAGLGAHDVLVGRDLDHGEVRALTGGKGVEIALDHVGGDMVMSCVRSLAAGGRLVTTGASAGPKPELDLRYLFMRDLDVRGAYMGPKSALERVMRLAGQGELRPLIHEVFPLERAADAQRVLEERKVIGKVVLEL
ncbi:MAG TPA: alcohol dehydrogenase catalytic domain-containing protein [Egibacteraceae bacterium]|nr:alcohol dehydrogenase catalytic domain-containing protein [Egibacteraceae bacterium]